MHDKFAADSHQIKTEEESATSYSFRPVTKKSHCVPDLRGVNMAAEGDVDLDLEAEENCTGKPAEKPRKHDSGAADLERVTDYAEEKEISSSDLETVRLTLANKHAATTASLALWVNE